MTGLQLIKIIELQKTVRVMGGLRVGNISVPIHLTFSLLTLSQALLLNDGTRVEPPRMSKKPSPHNPIDQKISLITDERMEAAHGLTQHSMPSARLEFHVRQSEVS